MYVYPTETGYQALGWFGAGQDDTEKMVLVISLAVNYGINSFMSLWFAEEVYTYYQSVLAIEEAEEDEKLQR